jgi:hypothetical protein
VKHRYTWHAWAINGGYRVAPGAHPYVGQYEASNHAPGAHQRGFPVAAYRTREAAREALRAMKAEKRWCGLYKSARIVRVEINATFDEGSAT